MVHSHTSPARRYILRLLADDLGARSGCYSYVDRPSCKSFISSSFVYFLLMDLDISFYDYSSVQIKLWLQPMVKNSNTFMLITHIQGDISVCRY